MKMNRKKVLSLIFVLSLLVNILSPYGVGAAGSVVPNVQSYSDTNELDLPIPRYEFTFEEDTLSEADGVRTLTNSERAIANGGGEQVATMRTGSSLVHDDEMDCTVLDLPGASQSGDFDAGSLTLPTDLYDNVTGETGFSVSFWVKAETVTDYYGTHMGNHYNRIFESSSTPLIHSERGLNDWNDPELLLVVGGVDTGENRYDSAVNIREDGKGYKSRLNWFDNRIGTGDWKYVTATITKDEYNIYLNGVKIEITDLTAEDANQKLEVVLPKLFDEIQGYTSNSLGQSIYQSDPTAKARYKDFRFYEEALTEEQTLNIFMLEYGREIVTLDKSALTLKKGGASSTLQANVSSESSDTPVSWSSSDETVATVEADSEDTYKANVTAVEVGAAIITVETESGTTATCTVTVEADAESISITPTNHTMNVGDKYNVATTVVFIPTNTTDKTLTWVSSTPAVASVGATNGMITALAKGTTTIEATTANNKKATCVITVNEVDAESITVSPVEYELNVGGTKSLTVNFTPQNTTNKVLTWTSSNTAVATVSGTTTGTITAVGVGTATITATTVNGKEAKCTVTVLPDVVEVSSITMKTAHTMKAAETYDLASTVIFNPADTTNKSLTWVSSVPGVATVDKDTGKITAVSVGKTTIKATTENGKEASCEVTVEAKTTSILATSVKFVKKSVSLSKVGASSTLKTTLLPATTTDKLTWSSSNSKIVSVNQSGKITAKKFGTATITVKTTSGKKDTCTVTVGKPATKLKLNKTKLKLNLKKKYTLKATITPKATTDKVTCKLNNKNVTASKPKVTKNKNVYKIIITAKKKGKTSVTVKTTSGKKVTCNVTVK